MSCLFFNGPPGHGKTFHITAYVLHCLDLGLRVAYSSGSSIVPPAGVRVVDLRSSDDVGEYRKPDMTMTEANSVEGPVLFRFEGLQDILGLTDCQVFKDEAQNDLGARDWEKMTLKLRIFLSEHRHYRLNLFFYTQHYKFVDVYPRRLALGSVYTIVRFLRYTFEIPRPAADPETGELGPADILGLRIIVRPRRGLDLPLYLPGFLKLMFNLSRRVPAHYTTHAPHRKKISAAPAAPGSAGTREKRQIPLL